MPLPAEPFRLRHDIVERSVFCMYSVCVHVIPFAKTSNRDLNQIHDCFVSEDDDYMYIPSVCTGTCTCSISVPS